MPRMLLSGATGMVGSSVIPYLRKAGFDITFLVRPNGRLHAQERIENAVGSIELSDGFIDADLNLPLLGISDGDIRKWRGQFAGLLHCAASTNFDEANRDSTKAANIDGTQNILKLACALKVPHLHHVSTAYVAGSATVFAESDLFVGQQFRNTYEESKAEAERIVRKWSGGTWTVYRPSICIGDSISGYTRFFNGYYRALKRIAYLKDQIQKLAAQQREMLSENDIFFKDGCLSIPITLGNSPVSHANLITSDWMAKTLVAAVLKPAPGQTFHVVHDSPPLVQSVLEQSLECLKISGVRFAWRDGPAQLVGRPFLAQMQNRFDEHTHRFLPYSMHEATFLTDNLRAHLAREYKPHPPITSEMFAKMLAFAIRHKFSKRCRIIE